MDEKEAILELNKLTTTFDIEKNHLDADKILCSFLRKLGYNELVDAYKRIEKWYA